MAHFVVTYRYGASAAALAAARPARYRYFAGLEASGALLASGQLTGGDLGEGMLVLKADDEAAARALLADDPFMLHGYVSRLEIAPWNPTTGRWVR